MSPNVLRYGWIIFGGCIAACLCVDPASAALLPPAAKTKIDFAKHIQPILKNQCGRCHSGHSRKGGFSIDRHADFVKGGEGGKSVVVGQSAKSLIIGLVTSADKDERMPMKSKPLTAEQIGLLRAWIDQGLTWPEGFSFTTWRRAPIEPRKVQLPAGAADANPIDRLVGAYWKINKTKVPPKAVDDRAFIRRVSLDLVGVLPTPAEVQAFVDDTKPAKHERLVDRLLNDKKAYAEHWMTFWSDMLRNAYKGTGFIDGGRRQITQWLYASLYENKPYDQFVSQLINPAKGAEGFIKGIKWRGNVSAAQRPEMQAAQNVSQVFLGTNLKCASCHDSFINYWRITDTWGLASVFADNPLEIYRCGKPTAKKAPAAFLYPQLGAIDPKMPKNQRIAALAKIITSPKNGRLSRTMVNRLWASLFGRGIVEPIDDMDQLPWDADLLDWLASDFAEHKYDLKRTLRLICTSQAYRLQSQPLQAIEKDYAFKGPLTRRMSAEQFIDAVSALTRTSPGKIAAKINAPVPASASGAPAGHGKKVFDSGVMKTGSKAIDVDITGGRTLTLIVTDGRDGVSYDWADWGQPVLVSAKGEKRLTDLRWKSATTGYQKVRTHRNAVNKPMRLNGKVIKWGLGTHAPSQIIYTLPKGVTRFKAIVGPDTGSTEQKGTKVSIRFLVMVSDKTVPDTKAGIVRTALVNDDPLSRALGRPNREQVVTQRESLATTLQALELTNGQTLNDKLKAGAKSWLEREGADTAKLVEQLYLEALCRKPNKDEARFTAELLGEKVTPQNVEDLLWIVTMLPDFQLIR
jgi:hypothetical protein